MMTCTNPAPVAVFAYNRPELLELTIEALSKNMLAEQSDLLVFSDGAKSDADLPGVERVRKYLKTVDGFRSVRVIERERNYGLSVSIIDGVTQCIGEFGRIIVLEDDLVTSPWYLKFMNDALDMYSDDDDVISVQGYVYPSKFRLPEYFFIKGADCQGWATWTRGWKLFEPDGERLLNEIESRKLGREFNFGNNYPYVKMLRDQVNGKKNSWAIRWYASAFVRNKYTLYPGKTMILNTGFGSEGTNTSNRHLSKLYNSPLNQDPVDLQRIEVLNSAEGMKGFISHFRSLQYWRTPAGIARKVIEKLGG
jgi:glycosyltransferase involved in cell wall biosynthesis